MESQDYLTFHNFDYFVYHFFVGKYYFGRHFGIGLVELVKVAGQTFLNNYSVCLTDLRWRQLVIFLHKVTFSKNPSG